ncbi:protein of unknown function [Enterobacter cancerogenus]|nr:protein of unknown function [Enterobacter cancerogenus]
MTLGGDPPGYRANVILDETEYQIKSSMVGRHKGSPVRCSLRARGHHTLFHTSASQPCRFLYPRYC